VVGGGVVGGGVDGAAVGGAVGGAGVGGGVLRGAADVVSAVAAGGIVVSFVLPVPPPPHAVNPTATTTAEPQRTGRIFPRPIVGG
jgi:hypothetical protein